MQGSQHIGKKPDLDPGSTFHSLCVLGQVTSPIEGSVSLPAIDHIYGPSWTLVRWTMESAYYKTCTQQILINGSYYY